MAAMMLSTAVLSATMAPRLTDSGAVVETPTPHPPTPQSTPKERKKKKNVDFF
jgi:hypothetical protein